MNLTNLIKPNSQQVNAEDLLSGPRTVTITSVEEGTSEQQVFVHLAEFPGRTYRPSKTMARLMVAAWGPESSEYTGHQLTLYRNPEITFGPNKVGGIEISHMSHIDKPIRVALAVTRGKRKDFAAQPLTAVAQPARADVQPVDQILATEWISTIQEATTTAQLQAAWAGAVAADVARDPKVIAAKDARKLELS